MVYGCKWKTVGCCLIFLGFFGGGRGEGGGTGSGCRLLWMDALLELIGYCGILYDFLA